MKKASIRIAHDSEQQLATIPSITERVLQNSIVVDRIIKDQLGSDDTVEKENQINRFHPPIVTITSNFTPSNFDLL